MRIRSPKDFWAGLIFVAIGAGFILLSHQYSMGNMHRMGPALFPTLVGALASRESRPLETVGLVVVLMVFSAAVFVWLLGLPIPLWPEA